MRKEKGPVGHAMATHRSSFTSLVVTQRALSETVVNVSEYTSTGGAYTHFDGMLDLVAVRMTKRHEE